MITLFKIVFYTFQWGSRRLVNMLILDAIVVFGYVGIGILLDVLF